MLGASGIFRLVAYLIVSKRRLFNVGRVITSRTGNVSVPPDLSASRSFSIVAYLIVSKRRLFNVCGVVASRAGNVSIPAVLGAGGCFCLVALLIVTECIYDLGVAIGAERTGVSHNTVTFAGCRFSYSA